MGKEMGQYDGTALAIREESVLIEYKGDDGIQEVAFDFSEKQLSDAVNRSTHTGSDQ